MAVRRPVEEAANKFYIGMALVTVFFFGGVQLFFIGILGEYIAAIHSQVRRGPVIDDVLRINFEPPDEESGKRDKNE